MAGTGPTLGPQQTDPCGRSRNTRTGRETVLDVEMKFFDGLTDLHQQVVSLYGRTFRLRQGRWRFECSSL